MTSGPTQARHGVKQRGGFQGSCTNLAGRCIYAGQMVPPAGFELADLLAVRTASNCGNQLSNCGDNCVDGRQGWTQNATICHLDGMRMARGRVGRMAGKRGHRSWGRIRRLPSKRYQANYVGPDLVRQNAPTTFTTKMDAEAWLHAERRYIEMGSWVAPRLRVAENKARAVTLGEYAQTWIGQRHLKPRTRIAYQALLDRHIAVALGRVPVNNLTPE